MFRRQTTTALALALCVSLPAASAHAGAPEIGTPTAATIQTSLLEAPKLAQEKSEDAKSLSSPPQVEIQAPLKAEPLVEESTLSAETPQAIPMHAFLSEEWKQCVIKYSGFGGILGAVTGGGSQLWALMAAENFAEAAAYVVRVVGPAAVKGGAAGLAAALAASSAWCSTAWA